MTLTLRPSYSDDYAFALELYIEGIRSRASAWIEWADADQEAQFATLWRPNDTRIITLNSADIRWVEFCQTGNEVFLRQLYIAPAHQRHGTGT